MSELADRLRALPSFPEDMPGLDPDAVPEDPAELFLGWLEDAIASGARQPHAMTFQTLDGGAPVGTTLGIKHAFRRAYGLDEIPSKDAMIELAEPWRPYRTRGSEYLWRSLATSPI